MTIIGINIHYYVLYMDECTQNGTKYPTARSIFLEKAAEIGLGDPPGAAGHAGGKAAGFDPPAHSLRINIQIVGNLPDRIIGF